MRLVLTAMQASLIASALVTSPGAQADLRLANTDFGDLTGLSSTPGAPGWYDGVPAGWHSSAAPPPYSVHAGDGPAPPTCNISQLGFLEQSAGRLAEDADVVLTFDVSEPWQPHAGIGAAILDGAGTPLAHSWSEVGQGRVVARSVAAGTELRVQFWALWGTTPGLDTVALSTHPPGSQPAEDVALPLRNHGFDDLTGLSPHPGAEGWYDGVPVGWQSSATESPFSLHTADGPAPPTCNVSQLGFLEQSAGLLTQAADVVLSFDVSEPWQLDAAVGAAILDGTGAPLAHSWFQAGTGRRVVARSVAAGTVLRVQFWAMWGTTPGLDNAKVTIYPPGSQPTEEGEPAPPAPTSPPGPLGELDALFRDPPNAYRIVQYSGHDGEILPVARMREYGIGGVMLFLSRHDYLRSKDAWTNLAATVRLARAAGMQVWLADDNGYPSGQAGGRVVESDPTLELRCLTALVLRGEGPQPAGIDVPPGDTAVSAVLYPVRGGRPELADGVPLAPAADRVETAGREGPWELWAFVSRVNNDEGSPARGTMAGFGTTGHYPNLLEPVAAERFVDLVHEEFARRLGPLEGQVDVIYTNEPHLGSIWHAGRQRPDGVVYVPWSLGLPERFAAEHGYELTPRLAALFEGASDEARLTRRHFYETVGRLYSENVSGRVADWAGRHGVRAGGHLLMEEHTDMHVISYGNLLRAIGDQQVPGCDVPMPDIGEYWDYWTPRLPASAAQLRGRETVSVLIDPIIGRAQPSLNPVPRRMMRFINTACLMGANQVTSYIPWGRYHPSDYRKINEAVGRLSVVLRGARNATQIALYYPIESFQARYVPSTRNWIEALGEHPETTQALRTQEELIRGLYAGGCDFSWLDGEAVCGGAIRDGLLVVGEHAYSTILMPRVELLPLDVVRRLRAFESAGGRVLWVDAVPDLGDTEAEHPAVQAELAGAHAVTPAEALASLGAPFPSSFRLRLEGADPDVLVGRYLRADHPTNLVVNNRDARADLTLRLEDGADGYVWLYDPTDGSIVLRAVPGAVSLPPCSSLLVIE